MYFIRKAQEHHRNVELYLYRKVGLFVGPSVGWLVTLLSKTREINVSEQIVDRGSILGSLVRVLIAKRSFSY